MKKTRRALTLTVCAAALAVAAPAAYAEEVPVPAGEMLAETVHADTSAAGNATCTAPALFNPLTGFKDRRDYFVAPAGDFEDPQLPGWQLEGGASLVAGGSTHAVLGPPT